MSGIGDRPRGGRWAHLPILIAVLVAGVVRAAATAGYPSVLWFGDSNGYLSHALWPSPSPLRPWGYSLFLLALSPSHSFVFVVAAQHLLGIATGALVYALVYRGWPGNRMWAGASGVVAAAPSLFDGYQVELEHLLMSDALFIFLVVAAVALVTWWRRPPWWLGAPAGLLLGAATLTRTVGVVVAVVLVGWLVARRAGLRMVAMTVSVLALCLVSYCGWFFVVHGRFAITSANGVFFYNRTAAFADCAVIRPRPALAGLCRDQVRQNKKVAPGFAVLWTRQSPFRHIRGGVAGRRANALAGAFARQAIMAQPWDYARVVVRDTAGAFAWRRTDYPTSGTVARYRYPGQFTIPAEATGTAAAFTGTRSQARAAEPYAGWVRAYQRHVSLPGTLLGVALAIGAAGLLRRRSWSGAAAPAWLSAVALLVVPVMVADFDYRYVLPVVPLAMIAAVPAAAREGRGQ